MPIPVQDIQTNQNQPTSDAQTPKPQVDPNTSTQQTELPLTPAETKSTPPVEDIVSRVSSVVPDPDKSKGDTNQGDILTDAGFDRNQWNDMLSKLPPDQKQQLEAAYKSLQRGSDVKFQKAAEMLKQAQATSEQPWTLDRVQQLTQDPAFVQVAQQYANLTQANQNPQGSGLSDDDWSNLSEQDRSKFQQMQGEQKQLKSQLNNIILSQEDAQLAQRYKNYDSTVVNNVRQGIQQGKIAATSEDIWRSVDYEPAIQRAYKLGREDRALDIQPKIDATGVGTNGINVTPSGDAPVKAQGENTVNFFRRLAEYNKKRVQAAQRQQ